MALSVSLDNIVALFCASLPFILPSAFSENNLFFLPIWSSPIFFLTCSSFLIVGVSLLFKTLDRPLDRFIAFISASILGVKSLGVTFFFLIPNFFKKLLGNLSKTELELGGIPNSSEDIKQAHASAIESYIEEYVGRIGENHGNMFFQRTLEDWARFDISRRTAHDASISSGLAIMACRKHLYRPRAERTVTKVPFALSKYRNEGTRSEIIK